STSTAATSRRSNSRLPTTLNARDQPPAEVSDQRVSGLTGAVHNIVNMLHGVRDGLVRDANNYEQQEQASQQILSS
ncbi:hypothetical protein ACNJSN_20815, partial [Mycobacterium tuberculosis]